MLQVFFVVLIILSPVILVGVIFLFIGLSVCIQSACCGIDDESDSSDRLPPSYEKANPLPSYKEAVASMQQNTGGDLMTVPVGGGLPSIADILPPPIENAPPSYEQAMLEFAHNASRSGLGTQSHPGSVISVSGVLESAGECSVLTIGGASSHLH